MEIIKECDFSPDKFQNGLKMDNWQKEVIKYNGNQALRCGRQTGKTEIIAEKAFRFSIKKSNKIILIIATSARQSNIIFSRINEKYNKIHEKMLEKAYKNYLKENPNKILHQKIKQQLEYTKGIYKTQTTLTKIELTNNTKILCLPTGRKGIYIRGFTIDLLIADESAYIPETVFNAILPMLAIAKKKGDGDIILLSTPFGKGGFFYKCCFSKQFKQYHIKSSNCKRISQEFLQLEKNRLTKQQYAQEYDAEFIFEKDQLIKTELIKKSMNFINWDFEKDYNQNYFYYLGVDVARYGADENAFVIMEKQTEKQLRIIFSSTTQNKSITETAKNCIYLIEKYKILKTLIDDNGVGSGVVDILIDYFGKNKIVGINNRSKSVSNTNAKMLKEDLYSNIIIQMEKGYLSIKNDIELLNSLLSVKYEYTSTNQIKIHGKNTHLAEAFIRAVWGIKYKHLKLFII